MSIITILLFFIYTWGLGFTATKLIKKLKESDNLLERNLMRVGIGLGVFVVLGVLLNLLRVPLDWKIFLVLSLTYPLFILFGKIKSKELKKPELKFRLTKSNLNILIVLLIFLVCLYMYAGGAFKYPYLEDDDPWSHALGVKYISIEKTAYEPIQGKELFHYIDPYPPGYEIIMGVLHQTNNSVYWTLKFFNALIISLGIVFFYFFAKLFTGSQNKALFSTFVLAALPSFFTHFIWAHSLVIMLFFPAMYCLEMVKNDKRWMYLAMVIIAGVFLTQPSQAIKIGILFMIYFVIKSLYEKKFLKNIFYAGAGGLLISFLWWFNKATSLVGGISLRIVKKGGIIEEGSFFSKMIMVLKNQLDPSSGTATKPYSFNDFFIAKPFGGINVQVGWGIFITLLVIIGSIYLIIKYKGLFKKENTWITITICWFIFTFLGTNSMTFHLPIGLYAFRFWLLLAIPVALLTPLGLEFAISLGKKVKIAPIMIILVVIFGILATSGYQKYYQNTQTVWPPGQAWTSMEEVQAYTWLKTLPVDTKVFMYAMYDVQIIGLDKYSCVWCDDIIEFKKKLLDKDIEELHSWLKLNKYEYVIISGISYTSLQREFGENRTKEVLATLPAQMVESGKFKVAYQNEGAIIFNVI